jgi:hypothetical protein
LLWAALARVRSRAGKTPLPRVSDLVKDEHLRRDDDNVRASLRYAAGKLHGQRVLIAL